MGFEPGPAEQEAQTLPLCYAAPLAMELTTIYLLLAFSATYWDNLQVIVLLSSLELLSY